MSESIEYILFWMLSRGVQHLSLRSAQRIGALLGSATFRLTGFRKAVTFDNLEKAFPGISREERNRIALGAFRNYGMSVVEMLWSGGASEETLRSAVTTNNAEVVSEALTRGKGVLLLSAHFGPWEFLVTGLRLRLGVPFTMIVQHQRNGRIDAVIDRNRSRFGNVTIPMGPSVREVLKALQAGRVVALLGDQSGSRESVYVDFFGRPAATHRGAAAFSLRTGAPIVMAFLVRQADGTAEAVFEELDRSGLNEYTEENIVELTRRHTALLEQYVRRYPELWLWMHKRWKHTSYYTSHREDLRS
jgi:Kdo2-lipid IVA lauroyltransferase/acyltransferase